MQKKVSFKFLILKKVCGAPSVIRVNKENGYPFITLLDKDNKAMNLYFGQESAKMALRFVGQQMTGSLMQSIVLGEVWDSVNASGEDRFKISMHGVSDYGSTSEMNAILGISEEEEGVGAFDLARFQREFRAKDEVPERPVNNSRTPEELRAERIAELEAKLLTTRSTAVRARTQAELDTLLATPL